MHSDCIAYDKHTCAKHRNLILIYGTVHEKIAPLLYIIQNVIKIHRI